MFCSFVCSIAASTPVEQWTCRSIASQVSISIINVTHICIMNELCASKEFGKQFPFLCNLISFNINFTYAHFCSCNSDRPGSCETTTFFTVFFVSNFATNMLRHSYVIVDRNLDILSTEFVCFFFFY